MVMLRRAGTAYQRSIRRAVGRGRGPLRWPGVIRGRRRDHVCLFARCRGRRLGIVLSARLGDDCGVFVFGDGGRAFRRCRLTGVGLVVPLPVELVFVDHHQEMARVGQARKAGRVGGACAGNKPLDDAVSSTCHVRDQGSERLRPDAERGKSLRSRLDMALGIDEGDEMSGLGEA
ncbi:MAG: hypothetical protein E5X24_30585, partial [Mesorhizobium sp.]